MEKNELGRAELGNILGSNIHDARLRSKLSQEALALEAGVNQSYIGKLERGEIMPGPVNLSRLAAALDVCVGSFFDRDPFWNYGYRHCPYSKDAAFRDAQHSSLRLFTHAEGDEKGGGDHDS